MRVPSAAQPRPVARTLRSFAVAAIFLATLAPSGVAASARPDAGRVTVHQSNNRVVMTPTADRPATTSAAASSSVSTAVRRPATGRDGGLTSGPAAPRGTPWPFSWKGGIVSPPGENDLTAGGIFTIRFSLGGNRGLDIFVRADHWPRSQRYNCATGALTAASSLAAKPFGMSGLSYDAATDTYSYNWQTRQDWSGTCREFQMRLDDGTYRRARFEVRPFHFTPPLVPSPALNNAPAGPKLDVRFHLAATGLDIFAAGYPRSRRFDCVTNAFIGPWAQTDPHPPAGLTRPATNEYRYRWQTVAAWASTCRRFEMKLTDGSVEVLRVRFNRPPVAVDDSGAGFATDEATAFTTGNVLPNDSDPDGDSFAVTGMDTTATQGTVTNNGDGTFIYGPNAQFEGLGSGESDTDTFDYTITDAHGATDTATVTITVSGLNDAPTIAAQTRSVAEGAAIGANVGAPIAFGDVDTNDGHTFAITGGNGDGKFAIDANTGQLTVAGALDHEATASYGLTVQVTDDGSPVLSDSATITVNVTDANDAPTDIALSNATVAENQPSGTTVGTLSTTDQDGGDSHTYTLVSGVGDTDNASFSIDGSTLKTAAIFDVEAQEAYTVRIQTNDGNGGTFQEQLAITVTDANDAPTDVALSNASVAENQASGTVVGTLSGTDQDPGDSLSFSLVAGAGSTDNALFQIVGTQLQTAASLDHEAAGTRSVRIQVSDGNGGTFAEAFTITVTDVNEAPTDIAVSPATVAENQPIGTTVGTLSTTDQDAGDSHTYTLVAGTGDTDNASFQIDGSVLETNGVFDFETDASYTVRIRTTDAGGLFYEEAFTITVTDVNDAPTDIVLDDNTVVEGLPAGTKVGGFTTTDQDSGQTHTYSLVSGAGDTDNPSFAIDGADLETSGPLTIGTYSIRVRTTDNGTGNLTYEEVFSISVVPANQAPTDIQLSNASVAENQPAGTTVGNLTTTDPDGGDTHTYSLVAGTGDTDNASFQIDGATLETAAVLDFEAQSSYSVRIQTMDSAGNTFGKAFTITATDANDAPTDIALDDANVAENQPIGSVVGNLSTTDQDGGDTHTYTLVAGAGDAGNASFQIAGSQLQTNAVFDFETQSSYSVRIRTTDSGAGSLVFEEAFTITVTDVNDAPVISTSAPTTATEDTLYSYDANATDPDGPSQTWSVLGTDTCGGSIVPATGVYTFTPAGPVPAASCVVSIQVCDGGSPNACASQTATVTITATNDAPVIDSSAPTTATEDTLYTYNATRNDPDGPSQTWSKLGTDTCAGSSIVAGTGVYTFTPLGPVPAASCDVSIQVCDVGSPDLCASQTTTVTITAVNDAPIADNELFNGNDSAHGNTSMVVNDPSDGVPTLNAPKTVVAGDLLDGDTDPDGPGPLTIVAETKPTANGGQVVIEADGDFIFHPEPSASCTDTSDSFTYTVSDQNPTGPGPTPGTTTGTVTIALSGCVWYVNNNAAGNSGTSAAPFDTLAQAETASGINHTVFVFDGDNTSTGYTTGFAMNSGERLIGEHEGLVVTQVGNTADTLHPANAGAHPTLTATNEDVIELDDGNEVRGFNLDPSGTGSGIAGSSGDTGGATIDDVNIIDTGTAGSQPGLELDGTTGTFNLSNLVVNSTAATTPPNTATGVRLNNAGTVNLTAAGTISITTTGAKGLDATSTNLGTSTFDDITVTGSAMGGVFMSATTGTTTFSNLQLTTTSGATAAFHLASTGNVTVVDGGTANVSATGGPAVDVSGATNPTLAFDDVDSTNSVNDGINLVGLGTGTFSANTSSSIANAAGIAFDLDGGSGLVDYDGTITNGEGTTADITGRTGNTNLDGAVTDSGDSDIVVETAINLSGNTAGTTSITHATLNLNTGEDHAVVFNSSDGHTLNITGGALNIDTTSGKGLEADTSGTLSVTGSVNTIDTTTGRALHVSDTDIGNNDLTLRSISSNGASNGIRLNNTANANGRLFVTSTGSGTCTGSGGCTGGFIQNSTGAGVILNNVPGGAEFMRLGVSESAGHGIEATTVSNGILLDRSFINSNGNDTAENGVDYNNVTGVVAVRQSDLIGSGVNNDGSSNFDLTNTSGTIHLTINDNDFNLSGTDDGLQVTGGGTATLFTSITGNRFDDNKGDAIQVADEVSNSITSHHTITGNTINGKAGTATDGGIAYSTDGTSRATISNNTVTGVSVSGIILNPVHAESFDATANSNLIGTAGVQQSGSEDGDGMQLKSVTDGTSRIVMSNNNIRGWQGAGMRMRASESQAGGTTHLTAQSNTIGDDEVGAADAGIWLQSGSSSLDVQNMCANVGGAGALANTFTTPPVSAPAGIADFVLDLRFANSTMRLPGYTGTTVTDRENYFEGRNSGFATFAQDGIQNPGNEVDGSCDQPSAPTSPTAPPAVGS